MNVKVTARKRDAPLKVKPEPVRGAGKMKNSGEIHSVSSGSSAEDIASFFGWDNDGLGGREALNSATYYACMKIRCSAFAKLPIKIKQYQGRGSINIRNSDLNELLQTRPNRWMSAYDLKFATEFQRIEYGDSFWYMDVDGRGKLRGIYPLDSQKMQIYIDDKGILGGVKNAVYYVYSGGGEEMIFTEEEICHFKSFSKNGIVGTPLKKYLFDCIDSELYSGKLLKERYEKGLQDPIIVQYIGELNQEKEKKIQKKFELMGGAKQAGLVIPIPPDFKVEQLETRLVNNQFFELQGLNARNIANAFGVKSFQLNDLERSTYSNIETQNIAFYTDTLLDVMSIYEQEIDWKILTTEQRKDGWYFKINVDAILRADSKTRAEQHQIEIASGTLMPAEAREQEDRPYIPGTDVLIYGNGASVPLDQLGKQYDDNAAPKGGDDNE